MLIDFTFSTATDNTDDCWFFSFPLFFIQVFLCWIIDCDPYLELLVFPASVELINSWINDLVHLLWKVRIFFVFSIRLHYCLWDMVIWNIPIPVMDPSSLVFTMECVIVKYCVLWIVWDKHQLYIWVGFFIENLNGVGFLYFLNLNWVYFVAGLISENVRSHFKLRRGMCNRG